MLGEENKSVKGRGIMKDYETIIIPIFNYIVDRAENSDPNDKVGQLPITTQYIAEGSWFDKLTIKTNIKINKEKNKDDDDPFDIPHYNFIKATYNKTSKKIENGIIYIPYSIGDKRFFMGALSHEFMHLYEDYNRLKNKNNKGDGEEESVREKIGTTNRYNKIIQLMNNKDEDSVRKQLLGIILYYLSHTEQHAIVQEIFALVKNNREIDKNNYKEILCKEYRTYDNIIAIRDAFLPYLNEVPEQTWCCFQENLSHIFSTDNNLVDKKWFINYVGQSIMPLIKKINRAIHYGIEAHSIN